MPIMLMRASDEHAAGAHRNPLTLQGMLGRMTSPLRAIALFTATMLAPACWHGAPPASPLPQPVATAAAEAREIWRGVGHQFDDDSRWELVMTIDRSARVGALLGTIAYPTLGCSGVLERLPDRGPQLVALERMTDDPDHRCVDGGTITFQRAQAGETLDWTWAYPTGERNASAVLTRER